MRHTDREHSRVLPLLRNVTPASFAELLRGAHLQQLDPDIAFVTEGALPNFLYTVTKGCVELFSRHSGRETTTDIVYPKSSFDLAAAICNAPHLHSARTLAPSQILMIPAPAVCSVLQTDRAFARAVENELAVDCLRMIRALKNHKLRSGVERLANWILDTERRQGGRGKIVLNYDKRTLAAYLGMTPESLSRKFAGLAAHGVASSGREMIITDRQALRRWAKPDPLIDG
jgi:CRP/FNR family transcriptional activator FtrB